MKVPPTKADQLYTQKACASDVPGTKPGAGASSGIQRRRGAYLPHWTKDGAWYAVTFRLWDALPQQVLQSWLFERRNIVKTAEQMKRQLSKHEEGRLAYLY